MPKVCKIRINDQETSSPKLPMTGERAQKNNKIFAPEAPFNVRTSCNFSTPYSLKIMHAHKGEAGKGLLKKDGLSTEGSIPYELKLLSSSSGTALDANSDTPSINGIFGEATHDLLIAFNDYSRYAAGTYKGNITFEIRAD